MKNKLIIPIVLNSSISATFMAQSQNIMESDYAPGNIEYLTLDNEDGSTKTDPCITNLVESDQVTAFYYKCASGSSSTTIYPCPASPVHGYDGSHTLCTK